MNSRKQNKATKTKYIKVEIDKTQHKSKCRLCEEKDKTENHIINGCSKQAQKEYKTRLEWVGKIVC